MFKMQNGEVLFQGMSEERLGHKTQVSLQRNKKTSGNNKQEGLYKKISCKFIIVC